MCPSCGTILVMLLAVVLVGLAQSPACADEAAALRQSAVLAANLDVPGAVQRLQQTSAAGCSQARMAALYLSALERAREAYVTGGDAASLQPVMQAIATLEQQAAGGERRAELMRIVLMAAVAAAQSERADMALLLDHAMTLERRLVGDGVGAAPGVTAHDAAGDLWLQVHRFESAVAAYTAAAQLFGSTPRTASGLAKAAVQMKQRDPACRAYRALITEWRGAPSAGAITEARAFVATQCLTPGPKE